MLLKRKTVNLYVIIICTVDALMSNPKSYMRDQITANNYLEKQFDMLNLMLIC